MNRHGTGGQINAYGSLSHINLRGKPRLPARMRTGAHAELSRHLGIYPYTCVLTRVGAAESWPTSMGEERRMGTFELTFPRWGRVPVAPRTFSRFWRAEPVGKTDRVFVGRTREIGWRQVCRGVAAPGGHPEIRQGTAWSSSA